MPARGLGARYQGMNWIHGGTRWAIYQRDRDPLTGAWRCLWCARPVQVSGDPRCVRRVCLDHVVPAALGGGNAPSNLITACVVCNNQRRSLTFEEWLNTPGVDARASRRVLTAINTPLTRAARIAALALYRARPRYGKRAPPPTYHEQPEQPADYTAPLDDTIGAPDVAW
jgi:hypothetical protein